jgi:hypothetical protein
MNQILSVPIMRVYNILPTLAVTVWNINFIQANIIDEGRTVIDSVLCSLELLIDVKFLVPFSTHNVCTHLNDHDTNFLYMSKIYWNWYVL